MNINKTYRLFGALTLSLLLANAIVLKELHHFLGHDHHADEPICGDADYGEFHFHDLEYEFVECILCHFNFYPKEKVCDNPFQVSFPELIVQHTFFFQNIIFTSFEDLPRQRGPPSELS